MAGFPGSLADIDPNEMSKADLIVYGCKFPWDEKKALIHLLGLQAGTSTTNTLGSSAINLKGGTVHAPGQHAETFVVDSYWRKKDDYIVQSLKRCVREKVMLGIFRFDFNRKVADPADPTQFVVPGTYGKAYPNGMPNTEAVNNLLHSNITYNIEGDSIEGVTKQSELEPDLYNIGLTLYDYAHNTDIGGTMDPISDPLDEYMKSNGGTTAKSPAVPKV